MKVHITERPNGLFLITAFRPEITTIRGTDKVEAYVRPGDPIGLNNLCRPAIRLLAPEAYEQSEPLKTQRLNLTAELLEN